MSITYASCNKENIVRIVRTFKRLKKPREKSQMNQLSLGEKIVVMKQWLVFAREVSHTIRWGRFFGKG